MMRTLFNGCLLGLLLIAGFVGMPFLLIALERLLPFVATRWGYAFLLYGTSRWIGSVGSLWIVWILRDTKLPRLAQRNLFGRFAYLGMFAVGILWLLLYALCSEPLMWFEGDAYELLLYETEQQAQLFLRGLIAINLLIRWFGFGFTKAASGTVKLTWTGGLDLLEVWIGLIVASALYLGVIMGVFYSVRTWRTCVWLRRMAYRWWGFVVFHAAVSPTMTLRLNDPLPLILKILIVGIFTMILLAVLQKLKPSVEPLVGC
ncbi:MAG: hypothetical protein KatS3mg017_0641 [Fimbriimonadales bacterium]|nr:MAG: hypothetical protein KatS3mg017_0641 [Fimbriimonadales bacterium]